jgi:hypothetical protein
MEEVLIQVHYLITTMWNFIILQTRQLTLVTGKLHMLVQMEQVGQIKRESPQD